MGVCLLAIGCRNTLLTLPFPSVMPIPWPFLPSLLSNHDCYAQGIDAYDQVRKVFAMMTAIGWQTLQALSPGRRCHTGSQDQKQNLGPPPDLGGSRYQRCNAIYR